MTPRRSRRTLYAVLCALVYVVVNVELNQDQLLTFDRDPDTHDRNSTSRFRFCRASRISDGTESLPILFPCQGPSYDAFGERLRRFVEDVENKPSWLFPIGARNQTLVENAGYILDPTKWGRRPEPLPGNRTVLVMGNSHTRQIAFQWACQYRDQVKSIRKLETTNQMMTIMRTASHVEVKFDHGSTIIILTNTPLVYSTSWKQILLEILPHGSIDAVVLGKFNDFRDSTSMASTNFGKELLELERVMPEKFPSITNQRPPSLTDFLQVFEVPIVVVDMFGTYCGKCDADLQAEVRKHVAHPTPIRHVRSRKYVPWLGEGASDDRIGPGTCWNVSPGREYHFSKVTSGTPVRDPAYMHRCTGIHDGHPGLIAWDVQEALRDAWEEVRLRSRAQSAGMVFD